MALSLIIALFVISIFHLSAEDVRSIINRLSSMNMNEITSLSNTTQDRIQQDFKHLFINYYPKIVPFLHQYPDLCPLLFNRDAPGGEQSFLTHCPRSIGLERDPGDPTDPYINKPMLDYGFISRDRLLMLDLTNMIQLHRFCPENLTHFTSCKEDLRTIKILMSPDRIDMQSWPMPRSILIGDGKQTGSMIGGLHPENSRPFAPHLIAIKNAFVSSWGYIFDFERWYIHGGCSDRAWHHPQYEYDLSMHSVVSFQEPILSLVHPFPSMFYHEFVEMHSAFFMALPLLKAVPNITILLNKPLILTKFFPLLEALDIDLNNYNIVSMKVPQLNKKMRPALSNKLKGSIVYAPYVITPISLWCQYISRTTTIQMRQQYAKHLPYWHQTETDGIIVYDRYNLRPKRFLAEGYQIYQALQERYGQSRSVKMFYGNESLEETITMFRRANVFIAAHGGGQANMIFMPEGGLIVEFRPELWPVACYIDIADNLRIQHYLNVVRDNGRGGEMHVEVSSVLPILYSLIDNLSSKKS